ncbi:hypothetical protein ACRDU6_27450 [Mycolicibacterium sp. ELW1]|uniref:hypothetical protein n=1 Tax=Mycobacteriaceae TaxID=1762 RepID=UPI0011ED77A5|nr:hypothetical protein [Mycobacterium sp. ELW1]QEN15930.1 hypothetical protein D3H54_23965 [Mycobacterium sp. ELW1]
MSQPDNTTDPAAGGPASPARDDPGRGREADPDPASAAPTPISGDGSGPPTDDEPSPESDDTEPDADTPANREAAKFRVQRNQARLEVDRLRTQVETFQRQAVEAAIGQRMLSPADLWHVAELGDVLDTDGRVDQARLGRVLAETAAKRPHWFRSNAAPASEVQHDGKKPRDWDKGSTWQGLFQRASGRADAD